MAKNVLVLARRDHAEAMRIAAGLTILGHRVRLVFMGGPGAHTARGAAMAQLLALSDIAPETTAGASCGELPHLDAGALGAALCAASGVISV